MMIYDGDWQTISDDDWYHDWLLLFTKLLIDNHWMISVPIPMGQNFDIRQTIGNFYVEKFPLVWQMSQFCQLIDIWGWWWLAEGDDYDALTYVKGFFSLFTLIQFFQW
jgi:hypothetical protein